MTPDARSPRTAAGRALLAQALDPITGFRVLNAPVDPEWITDAILAIEAQAAPPDAPPDALRTALERTYPTGARGRERASFTAGWDAAFAAPATLPAIDTRIVWKRDHGMVIMIVHSTGDEEPQSLEIPAWAVRTIFDVAGKDPEEEARKVSAFINAHTGLDVERLALLEEVAVQAKRYANLHDDGLLDALNALAAHPARNVGILLDHVRHLASLGQK